jgi:hypothetical protein
MRKTFTLRTVQAVSPTVSGYALRVPIVQGDFPLAHLCRLVGVIEIPSASLKTALPLGSAIELTLDVDRGGALSVKAFLPAQRRDIRSRRAARRAGHLPGRHETARRDAPRTRPARSVSRHFGTGAATPS